MKCFLHPTNDALGICRNCGKGTCATCAQDGANGLACSPLCAERIERAEAVMQSAEAATKLSRRGAGYFQPLFLIVLGLGMLGHALWIAPPGRSSFGLLAGGLFVVFGIALGMIQRSWHKRAESDHTTAL